MASSVLEVSAIAAGLGALAGLRGIVAPALAANALSHHRKAVLQDPALHWLASAAIGNALKALAATEVLVDKVPGVPDRTTPPLLAWRALTGGVTGAAFSSYRGRRRWLGAAVGGIAAVAAAYAGLSARKRLAQRAHISQRAVGLIEDTLVVVGGSRLANRAFDSLAASE